MAATTNALAEYQRKRDFAQTPEPRSIVDNQRATWAYDSPAPGPSVLRICVRPFCASAVSAARFCSLVSAVSSAMRTDSAEMVSRIEKARVTVSAGMFSFCASRCSCWYSGLLARM